MSGSEQEASTQAADLSGTKDRSEKAGPDHHHTPVGAIIKRIRKEKGLSLTQLSNASGVSVGMLSQVERDVSSPTVRVLAAILRALDAPISVIFEPRRQHCTEDPSFVCRAEDHPVLELGHLSKELLVSKSPNSLQLMILYLKQGGSSGELPLSYPAEKGGVVLKGQIDLWVGSEMARLSTGDSFAFGPSLPHSFRHAGAEPAEVLWVIGPLPDDKHL